MQQNIRVFVGLDTSKNKISVALAEDGRRGEVRFFGDIDNNPDAVKRLVSKLIGKYQQLLFCYEAGPTGYGLHRQITALGHDCSVIAPSLIPKRPGEHVKTNHRDAVALARLHRAGEFSAYRFRHSRIVHIEPNLILPLRSHAILAFRSHPVCPFPIARRYRSLTSRSGTRCVMSWPQCQADRFVSSSSFWQGAR